MEIVDIEFDLDLYKKEDFKKEDIVEVSNKILNILKKNDIVHDELIRSHVTLFSCIYKVPVKIIGLTKKQVGLLIDDIIKNKTASDSIVAGRVSSMEHNKSYTVVLEMDNTKYHVFNRDSVPKENLEYSLK
jgi:hypothetical protein